ncbi:MAG: Nif3-like dinuclear metal center hexameric protein [Termitinemataceae bacterium]|nr:MAG: Nif3-like dinuclear metal center hexameric protein [Termitinemataceae bacterium]
MTTKSLDVFFRGFLAIDQFNGLDDSLNGIQVDNSGGRITKIAFAVDACIETFKRTKECGAEMLFVHHGLFWGKPLRVEGGFRERLSFLLSNNIALYAVHLPLDQNEDLGNNAVMCNMLGITNKEPFGLYHGKKIGYKGALPQGLTVEDAVKRIAYMNRPPLAVHPFGKKESRTCAVVSGGAAMESMQAIEEDIDMFITGEASHTAYHIALENNLNFIAGGHYNTEVWGVRAVMEKCNNELRIQTEFIDVPTGL